MPLNWKLYDIVFKDGRKSYRSDNKKANGKYYTRNEIVDLAQKEADKLKAKNKNAMIGIAYHFKNVNQWIPAIMTPVNDPVKIWNVLDSDKGHAYDGDVIDSIQYILIKRDDINPDPVYLKPRQAKPNVPQDKFTQESYFGKMNPKKKI